MITATPVPLTPWRAIARLARYRPGLFLLSFLQLVTWNGLLLLTGWLLQQVFDALTGSRPAGLDAVAIIALLAGAEAARLVIMWAGVVRARTTQQLRGLLRLNLLRAQWRSGGPDAGRPAASPGDALSRVRDDVDDLLALLDTAMNVAAKIILATGSVLIMLLAEPVIAVAAGLPLIMVVGLARLVRPRVGRARRAFRAADAAVTSLLAETFGSVLAVKSAQASGGILARLSRLNEHRRRTRLRDQLVTPVLGSVNRFMIDLAVGVVLLLAVTAVPTGSLTVGELALFVAYLGNLVWLPYYLGRLITRHQQAAVALDRMAVLLPPAGRAALVAHRPLNSAEAEPAGSVVAPPLHRLTVAGLTAVHPSGRGVYDIDLSLDGGTVTAITGPAGAGKTTLVRAVLGLLPSRAGTVTWNGSRVDDPAGFFTPPRSAYAPQLPHLFSETLRRNLLLGRDDDVLPDALRAAVLDRDVAELESGLETRIGPRGVRLSGGQAQRTAIARALAQRPRLLILDDVSNALDVETERDLGKRLATVPGLTLLVITSRPATLARADQVIRLDHGRIVAVEGVAAA
ncbi:ATP-binding cassette domain-containing protein [Microlunatus sp. GCM10028923]|uniref:ATP-binding cassette domain-containing protein n=1 Tax=Microlunatus sp. GCM10028923 TaxID=3273400 RepID=UPI003607D5A9